MKQTIMVAGATGHLGELIVEALIKRGAEVKTIVRPQSDSGKVEKLKSLGAAVTDFEMSDAKKLKSAVKGASCVVSALSGLHDTIVDTQTKLLQAAIEAGVPRFIPSDFSVDFTRLPDGDNRNFDLRKDFHKVLDKSPIGSTSIMNGAFSFVLGYNSPLFNVQDRTVAYWGDDPDWKLDFSTMENTADYTAAAALDPDTPKILRIASFQLSPNDLVRIGEEVKGQAFKLAPMGTLEDFAASNRKERAEHPEGEHEVFPGWQAKQYLHSMFIAHHESLDNDRYPDVKWTSADEVISEI